MLGFAFGLNLCPRKNAMTIPAISNNINTTIGTINPISTTVDVYMLPPSDIVLTLILGTPFAFDDRY